MPLDAGRAPADAAHERVVVELAGRAGRGRCARSRAAARRRPAETDRPPNIRWSTKRSSRGRRRARVEREPHPQVPLVGGAGGLHEHLAAHAEVAEQGVAAVEGQPEVLAAPAGAPRPGGRSARRRSRRGRARSRRTGRGCSTSTGSMVRADDVALEAGADDLDLGELGHGRPASVVEAALRRRSTRRPRRRGRRRSRRTPSRRRPARPPSWSGRRRCRRGCSPTRTCAVKVFMWSGPSSSMTYSGTPRPCSAESSWRRGLPVEAGAERGGGLDQRVEEQVHDLGRRPRSRR